MPFSADFDSTNSSSNTTRAHAPFTGSSYSSLPSSALSSAPYGLATNPFALETPTAFELDGGLDVSSSAVASSSFDFDAYKQQVGPQASDRKVLDSGAFLVLSFLLIKS